MTHLGRGQGLSFFDKKSSYELIYSTEKKKRQQNKAKEQESKQKKQEQTIGELRKKRLQTKPIQIKTCHYNQRGRSRLWWKRARL